MMGSLPSLSPVDIVAFAALLAGVIQGYRRKLSGELARFVSLLTAFVLGLYACAPFGRWLVEHTRLQESSARGVAFVTLLAAAVGVMFAIRYVLGRVMRVLFEPTVDLLGGCVAGFLRALVLVILVFMCMNMWEHDYLNRKFGEESVVGTLVLRWVPFAEDILVRLAGKAADIAQGIEPGSILPADRAAAAAHAESTPEPTPVATQEPTPKPTDPPPKKVAPRRNATRR